MKWLPLFIRWVKILTGKSYYHYPQRLGKAFRKGELAGYFNDLTGKTRWTGRVDEIGIPLNVLHDGRTIYFATTIVQKSLGHWDQWLLTSNDVHKKEFLRFCYWLLARQDRNGGWPIWPELKLLLPSPYSAMTQGECISAFLRAWKLTGDSEFLRGAKRAYDLMCRPIESGGVAIIEGQFFFLEEFPTLPRTSILNGWIFALFGLYDLWIATEDKNVGYLFNLSLKTLKHHLHEYDAGYWSYYDVKGRLSSPFYHDLHIHQLIALAMIYNDSLIVDYINRWIKYKKRLINRTKALLLKASQKIRDAEKAVIIQ